MTPDRWAEIQSLFVELVDLTPPEREARLEPISKSDPELYSEVLSLLEAHAQITDRLDPLEQLASPIGVVDAEAGSRQEVSDPYGLVGRTVSHYKVLEPLGGGGMGVLYKAADTRLDRIVALKFLPPQWSLDPGFKQRFAREARAAAALDHTNVCTIYEVGETDEGQLFIAMAFYEGETVKERLARAPLAAEEAMGLTSQAATGLAAAHAQGIVHRDIKPGNLMVTADGVLKILDFGLAKTAETALTDTGVRLGTPAYMSPEQTRGEEITPSTDLWSLGVVLYEMLTGERPFRAEQDRAVISAIRHEEPPAPSELREELPDELDELVLGLLSKDPQARYPGAERLSADLAAPTPSLGKPQRLLRQVQALSLWQALILYGAGSWIAFLMAERLAALVGLPFWFGPAVGVLLALGVPVFLVTGLAQLGGGRHATASASSRGFRRLLTWRNATVGGIGAFVLLGAVTAGYVAMRSFGIGPAATLIAQGVLDERGQVLVAQFANQTRDSLLGPAVTAALTIDLAQSPAVRVVEPGQLAEALERMEEGPDAKLDLPLARELARREGYEAVAAGTISRLGTGYVLSIELISQRGETLTSARATASDSTELISALDGLSKRLRERIGESLRSIRNSPPLEQVTTPSVGALKEYSRARHEEAIALDSGFAMAWRSLGEGSGLNRERQVEAYTKAFELRDRLPERERQLVMADYYGNVTGELDKSIAAYQRLLSGIDPEDERHRFIAVNNLGLRFIELRQFARAEELYRQEIQEHEWSWRPTGGGLTDWQWGFRGGAVLYNLATAQANLGKYTEALTTLQPDTLAWWMGRGLHLSIARAAAANGDYERAETRFLAALDVSANQPVLLSRAYAGLAAVSAVRGRLADAERYSRGAMAVHEAHDSRAAYVMAALDLVLRDVWLRGDTASALRTVETALAEHPIADLPPSERPYLRLASVYAMAEQVDDARRLLAEYESEVAPGLRRTLDLMSELHRARGELFLASGEYGEAVAEFRRSDVGTCVLCALPGLARSYDRAGEADSALALYERYVNTPFFHRLLFVDQLFLAVGHERLGQLYDAAGDTEKAAGHFAKFVGLWSDADDDLRPRVETALERLDELCAAVACDDLFPPPPTTGSLAVYVTQRGEDLDMNGFVVRVDLTDRSNPLWVGDHLTKKTGEAGLATFFGLSAGSHTVTLLDVWSNCQVEGRPTRTVTVTAGGTSPEAFDVICEEEPPAEVDVTGAWTGRLETRVRLAGDIFMELEQTGNDVRGFSTLEPDDEGETMPAAHVGRVSKRHLTLWFDFPGAPGRIPGRVYWYLEVSGSEMAGENTFDGLRRFGTGTFTRQ